MDNLAILLVTLLVGGALGALGAWLLLRRSAATEAMAETAAAERLRAAEASARADAESARNATAQADIRVQEARAEAERARAALAEQRTDAAEARSEAAHAAAQVATLEAQRVAAVAERDAALARAKEIAADRAALEKEFTLISGRALDEQGRKADASAERRLQETAQLMAPIKESLAAFNARLGEVEKARVDMARELAEQVKSVQHTGERLRRETAALSTALRRPQVRGAWGELQLKRIAELAGMVEHCDFVQQATSTTSEDRVIRPDMKVTLTEGKFVYVDAKVPLQGFLDAQEADDDRDREAHLAQFARNVKGHVDALGAKNYFKADPGTPEFVVMFIPLESLGAEALRLVPDLHEYASGRNVVVATPATLIAMLRAIAHGWRQAALAEAAAQVSQLGRELYDRLGKLGSNVDKLGRALSSAVKAYNASVGSLETRVLVSARRFRDLNVTDAELKRPLAVDEPLRPIAAPELVADAAAVPSLVGRGDEPGEGAEARPVPPEVAELTRPVPPPAELVGDEAVRSRPGRGTMAG